MKGTGSVTSKNGETPVQYELEVWEEQISTPLMDNPSASVPGMQRIQGWVRPVCCTLGEVASLEMQDGRKVKFRYTNLSGAIAVSGEWRSVG
jgi:hypothetical protein